MSSAPEDTGAFAVIERELIALAQGAASQCDDTRVIALNTARACLAEHIAAALQLADALRALPAASDPRFARVIARHEESVAHMLTTTH